MKIVCDSCGTKYSISDDKVRGKVFKIRCKKCSHIIVVRGTNEAGAAQPAATTDGGWHVVVDGEQVGPLPDGDVRAKLARGEINGETYIWKEGFSDWLKIGGVPEFADAMGGAVAAAPAAGGGELFADASVPVAVNGTENSSSRQRSGGLFGGAVSAAASAEESDVFAAPAPAAARGGGGDLFASAAVQPAASEEPRWPASGGGGGAANHDGGRVENLTGQRHENSVLFSLSNLQSLAMPSAASKPLANSAPTSEGSGLIDIRAMAATTLGTPDARGGGMDDLPAFGAFSSAAPVLLPLPSSSGPKKWVYFLAAGMLVIVVGIVAMAYKILNTKPVTVVEPTVAPAPESAKPAAVAAAAAPAAAAPTTPEKPSTIAKEDLPPREAPKAAAAPEARSDGKSDRHHGKGKDKDRKGSAASDDKKAAAAAAPAVAVAEAKPEKEEKRPAKGSLDDLLEGALTNRRPAPKARAEDDSPKAAAASAGPLSKSAIESGMKSVKPKVNDCYKQYKVGGMAMVKVVIEKSGKVSSATVSGPLAGTPTGSCVEKAVKSASFGPNDGLTIPYPFQLR